MRLLGSGHLVERDFATAVFVQCQRQLVGDDPSVLAGIGFAAGLLPTLRACFTFAARWREAEFFIITEAQIFAAHQSRHPHRQVHRSAARDVVDLHIHRHSFHIHQCFLVGRRHAPLQHWQAELLHAELAGAQVVIHVIALGRTAQLHLINSQLGRRGYGEAALGALSAGCSVAPRQRLCVLLAATHVGDDQRSGLCAGQTKAFAVLGAQNVLHRHGFACAQQRSVKNRVGTLIRPNLIAGGHVKAPWLYATVPVAPGEAHVRHAS